MLKCKFIDPALKERYNIYVNMCRTRLFENECVNFPVTILYTYMGVQ